MHLALFQSPDTVPLALPAVDDRIKPYIPELNQFPGTFPTKLEIIEQSSANVMLLKKLLKELQGILFFMKNYSISIFLKLECQKMFKTMHLRAFENYFYQVWYLSCVCIDTLQSITGHCRLLSIPESVNTHQSGFWTFI